METLSGVRIAQVQVVLQFRPTKSARLGRFNIPTRPRTHHSCEKFDSLFRGVHGGRLHGRGTCGGFILRLGLPEEDMSGRIALSLFRRERTFSETPPYVVQSPPTYSRYREHSNEKRYWLTLTMPIPQEAIINVLRHISPNIERA